MAIRIEGLDDVSRSLKAIRKFIGDSEIIESGMEQVQKFHDQNFLKQGSPKKWKPLSKDTEDARKKRTGYYKKGASGGGGILAWTGNLRDNNTTTIKPDRGEFKKNAPYARFHEEGSGKLPKRNVLPTDPRMITEIEKSITKSIGDFIVRKGLA